MSSSKRQLEIRQLEIEPDEERDEQDDVKERVRKTRRRAVRVARGVYRASNGTLFLSPEGD